MEVAAGGPAARVGHEAGRARGADHKGTGHHRQFPRAGHGRVPKREVYAGGPAERAGLRVNDIILSMNGEPIFQERQALLIAASTKPGDEIDVVAWRDGERVRTTVTATERPRRQP